MKKTAPAKPARRRKAARPVVLLVNGPNLDMLGKRDPAQYGTFTLADVERAFAAKARELGVEARFFQSGCEGELCKAIHGAMGYAAHPEYVGCMAVIVAMDAFQAIMFSKLRLDRRPLKFMALKFAFIIPNILLNLFIFLVICSNYK